MPPVILASAREGQTREAFEARAGRPALASASPKPSESCEHVVAAGDTLGQISSDKLGTAKRWREITALNPGLSPTALRPGSVLKIPCSGGAGDGAGEGGAGTPPARVAFLDRLRKALGGAETGEAARPAATREAPAAEADAEPVEEKPPLPPPPVWTAGEGEFLAEVLTRWGAQAGWTIIIDTTDAWRLAVEFRTEGAFDSAVAELIRGMGHDGVPPRVRLYPNQVLRLGGPL